MFEVNILIYSVIITIRTYLKNCTTKLEDNKGNTERQYTIEYHYSKNIVIEYLFHLLQLLY